LNVGHRQPPRGLIASTGITARGGHPLTSRSRWSALGVRSIPARLRLLHRSLTRSRLGHEASDDGARLGRWHGEISD
jgi:hypothetical protein